MWTKIKKPLVLGLELGFSLKEVLVGVAFCCSQFALFFNITIVEGSLQWKLLYGNLIGNRMENSSGTQLGMFDRRLDNWNKLLFRFIGIIDELWTSSPGLVVMHSTQTNMVLGSRPTADHWRRQEGHPVLNIRARIKVPSEAPTKPQGIGRNRSTIEHHWKIMDILIFWRTIYSLSPNSRGPPIRFWKFHHPFPFIKRPRLRNFEKFQLLILLTQRF